MSKKIMYTDCYATRIQEIRTGELHTKNSSLEDCYDANKRI